ECAVDAAHPSSPDQFVDDVAADVLSAGKLRIEPVNRSICQESRSHLPVHLQEAFDLSPQRDVCRTFLIKELRTGLRWQSQRFFENLVATSFEIGRHVLRPGSKSLS